VLRYNVVEELVTYQTGGKQIKEHRSSYLEKYEPIMPPQQIKMWGGQ